MYLSELAGFSLSALDNNDIGSPKDFLFNDKDWVVRYLVLDSHPWIPMSKKVLISPVSLGEPEGLTRNISVQLSHHQIKDGPMLDEHATVSRENEQELFQHYGYGYYWMGTGLWGTFPHPGALVEQQALEKEKEKAGEARRAGDDEHGYLRSVHEVQGYTMYSQENKKIGRVSDFVIDDATWKVEFIEVTVNDEHFMVPVKRVDRIDWAERSVHITRKKSELHSLGERVDKGAVYEREKVPA